MFSELIMLGLASAVVQYDFRIEHSGLSERNAQHSVHRRALQANGTNNNATNSTVQPLVNATLTTGYNFYHGLINVGSPAQQIDVLLDTGSPVSWVYGPQGSYNNATKFFSNQSSTYTKLNHSFSASYGSGQYLGSWGEDYVSSPQFVEDNVVRNVNLSNANITKVPFEFGVVSSFATLAGAPGLLGLGPHIDNAGPDGYMTLPEAYYHNNITSSPAFSVFLEEDEGRFLFGSVDTQYFQPPLYRYRPKTSLTGSPYGGGGARSKPTSWNIFLDGATLNHGVDYVVRSNVVLDTGSPVSLLPPGFVNAVGRSLGLTKYGKYETWYVNSTTDATLPNGTITFSFNGFKIDADIANFLVPGQYIWLDDGPQNVTALALMGSPNYLLGDAFFRSAYTVFDPSTQEVMLAQRTNHKMNTSNTTNGSTIIPISQLLDHSMAIINGTNASTTSVASTTSSPSYHPVATSLVEGDGVTTTVIVIAANQYLGTVDAEKAASMTATQSESSQGDSKISSISSSTAAASSASSVKTSSAKASSNSGSIAASKFGFGWGLIAALLLACI